MPEEPVFDLAAERRRLLDEIRAESDSVTHEAIDGIRAVVATLRDLTNGLNGLSERLERIAGQLETRHGFRTEETPDQ